MTQPSRQSRSFRQSPWRKRLLLWAGFVLLIFLIGLSVGYYRHRQAAPIAPVAVENPSQPMRQVLLYFASQDGQSLIAETGQIKGCQVDQECLRETLLALLAGPAGELAPILPGSASLNGVTVTDSLVTVDFSRELIAAHPGGTQSELLTIYGLTDTLAVNFPHLRQVQFLIEGAAVATLKGHVDLRQPISPDFSLVEEGAAPLGKSVELNGGGDR